MWFNFNKLPKNPRPGNAFFSTGKQPTKTNEATTTKHFTNTNKATHTKQATNTYKATHTKHATNPKNKLQTPRNFIIYLKKHTIQF